MGRTVVEDALGRGWTVTTFNRGRSAPTPGGADDAVERLLGDRLRPADVSVLAQSTWDVVVDTWAGAPLAVTVSAEALADRAERYVYVSSESVYEHPPPLGADESAAVVAAEADATDGDYPALKRGGELAAEAAFGDRALLARAATILGPHENIGRLPWWLLRLDRGGEVLAPGPPQRAIQYVDARDLARWLLDAATNGASGPFNVACRRGHATMASLLEACHAATGAHATLTWAEPAVIEAAGIEPWMELPVWLPPDHEYAWMHDTGGVRCRPIEETVRDTWDWLISIGKQPPLSEHAAPGLDAAKEHKALAVLRGQTP